MWNALAEFIDNSTQSRLNYESIVDDILKQEGVPLVVEIDYSPVKREISIKDNSIGMTKIDLINALKIAQPTQDSKGRSKYGMGMKTAACWIGNKWRVETCEWGSAEELCAEIDVNEVAEHGKKVPIKSRVVSDNFHYTRITISNLNRYIQKRTEETIRTYLGSIYRADIKEGKLKILYCGEEILPPDEYEFDTDTAGRPMKQDIPEMQINGKIVRGFVGILKKGGRKLGGFSLFQNQRQIQGFPNAWRPSSIFGGVDDEGANNLVSQRLIGMIELDEKFAVSHTKDAILFQEDEEEQLESFLQKLTKDYRNYAIRRRDARGQSWTREKVADLLQSMTKEFTAPELKDAINTTVLPPLDTIIANNNRQTEALSENEKIASFQVTPQLRIIVSLKETSEYEPYVILNAGAEPGTMHVIINGLHPYYASLESADAIDECIKQYIYDAIAEYQVSHSASKLNPASARRLKDVLLRAGILKIENAAAAIQEGPIEFSAAGAAG
jgi:hypothetical protein